MEKAQSKILNMVKEGNLSAEEANRLISEAQTARQESEHSGMEAPQLPQDLAEARAVGRLWKPMLIVMLGIAGLGLRGIAVNRKERGLGAFIKGSFSWLTFLTASLGAAIAYWSRQAPWVYLNVEPTDGPTVRLTFPLPLDLLARLTEFAASQEQDPEESANIRGASEFLRAMHEQLRAPGSAPVHLNVEDEDARVEIVIG